MNGILYIKVLNRHIQTEDSSMLCYFSPGFSPMQNFLRFVNFPDKTLAIEN